VDHSGCIDAEELKALLADFDADPAVSTPFHW
jgi:hypothetical protein